MVVEKIYEVEAIVKLEIPRDALPMTAVKSLGEISSNEAIEGKLVQLHTRIKKDLEGEIVKVKSGVYENMAIGEIVEVKRISLGSRKWEVVK